MAEGLARMLKFKRRDEPVEEPQGEAHRTVMRRDYWADIGPAGMMRVGVCKLHDPETDQQVHFVLDQMMEEAGIQDGDEFEILLVKTGKRPHGDRRCVRRGPPRGCHYFTSETDEEVERRICGNQK